MRLEPGDNLPVATGPAVMAFGIVDIVGGVVVEEFDIVDESATDMAAFEKVVAEDEVVGEGAFEDLLEYFQVVDTLAAERSLVEDILIELETGSGIDVKTAKTGEELSVTTLVSNLDINVDAGLHDAVATVYTAAVG